MRKLGSLSTFPLALGCMGMSGMYGPSDEDESIATIHAALDAGITLIDTGDFYGMGHNEMLIGRALRGRRESALLSVKFGGLRAPGGGWTGVDTRPVAVKNFLTYTLTRLGVDHIDIYRPARLDPAVPIEDTIGAIAEMVKAGYVRAIGLSEVGPETIQRAHAVHPIVDLQIEYSLISRTPEEKIFGVLETLGIGVTAYGVLSRGLLSGSVPTASTDFRAHLPRFTGENRAQNDRLVGTLRALAAEKLSNRHSSRSPGSWRRSPISSPSSARASARSSQSLLVRCRSRCRPKKSHASRKRSHPTPSPGRGTTPVKCKCWTVKNSLQSCIGDSLIGD